MFMFLEALHVYAMVASVVHKAKLYIPSTINIWKEVFTWAIWADKKWAGFWQISLYIKVINIGSDTFGNPIFQKVLQN